MDVFFRDEDVLFADEDAGNGFALGDGVFEGVDSGAFQSDEKAAGDGCDCSAVGEGFQVGLVWDEVCWGFGDSCDFEVDGFGGFR